MAVAIHENGVGTKLGRSAQRHSGMDSELAGLVGSSSNHATLVTLASDDHSFAFEGRVEQFFHRHEEGIHVEVEDGLCRRRHGGPTLLHSTAKVKGSTRRAKACPERSRRDTRFP